MEGREHTTTEIKQIFAPRKCILLANTEYYSVLCTVTPCVWLRRSAAWGPGGVSPNVQYEVGLAYSVQNGHFVDDKKQKNLVQYDRDWKVAPLKMYRDKDYYTGEELR